MEIDSDYSYWEKRFISGVDISAYSIINETKNKNYLQDEPLHTMPSMRHGIPVAMRTTRNNCQWKAIGS
jgi:hypothetical protein